MSSIQSTTLRSTSASQNSNDQSQWVIQIRNKIEHSDQCNKYQASIFNVPKTLSASDPESYTPQQVAIGPYHSFRPELCEMERYKVAAARSTERQLQSLNFETLVNQFETSETRIRGCYHKFLDVNDKTLRWMMAMDASFLLEFLLAYGTEDEESASPALDYSMRKLARDDAVLRDIIMLENQIPLFVLRKVLELVVPKTELQLALPKSEIEPEDVLLSMLMELCKDLSPFEVSLKPNYQPKTISECTHLLDFLYHMITPEEMDQNLSAIISKPSKARERRMFEAEATPNKIKYLDKYLRYADMARAFVQEKGLAVISTTDEVPGRLNSFFQVIKVISNFFGLARSEEAITNLGNSSTKQPLAEEIAIPSVSDLAKAGVRFVPKEGGIEAISFDPKTHTFYLPPTSLDVNTKVVLRNLVAYESMSKASGPLVLARYVELMNGIIDTEEDTKLLREKGIVLNYLKSDEEVTELWNGMTKSIKLTKVDKLDTVIEEVNKYYNSRWKVKTRKMLRTYVYGFWQSLALLASLVILLLMALQSFCSVYSCSM